MFHWKQTVILILDGNLKFQKRKCGTFDRNNNRKLDKRIEMPYI